MISGLSSAVSYRPRAVHWTSEEVLRGLTREQITASQQLRDRVHHDLWADLCAEYDAEHLWHYLQPRFSSYSNQFRLSMRAWRADELNHYRGLRKLYSVMFDVAEEEIDDQLDHHEVDFSDIEHLLVDEISTCTVLAYDELVSAKGYGLFLTDFREFGPPFLAQWVQRAARDEKLHYMNFLDIARNSCATGFQKIDSIVDKLMQYERKPDLRYRHTFLLDHSEETFSREFLGQCANQLLNDFACSSSSSREVGHRDL